MSVKALCKKIGIQWMLEDSRRGIVTNRQYKLFVSVFW